jgi:hypothetical protein
MAMGLSVSPLFYLFIFFGGSENKKFINHRTFCGSIKENNATQLEGNKDSIKTTVFTVFTLIFNNINLIILINNKNCQNKDTG